MEHPLNLRRRDFLYLAAYATVGSALPLDPLSASARDIRHSESIQDDLPVRPSARPLNWRERADAFDQFVTNPANQILQVRPDGSRYFSSALDGSGDGGLTTFAPLVLGKILRGDEVGSLVPSMSAYFSEKYGIFLDGTDAVLCEYWYLMNVNALAAGIIRSYLPEDPVWTGRVRSSADRLIEIAHQIHYNFNDQGYRFDKRIPFTLHDIYRQPDTIGGYAYLMLFAYEMFGDQKYLQEAATGIDHYQSFVQNPWYEIPSGAMACLAAGCLSAKVGERFNLQKIFGFVLDPGGHPLQTGVWGEFEVNGLMAGFSTEPPGEAYSMESLVTLPYLLPMLRYCPEFATDIGIYLLNTAANMRLFYADCISRKNQDRPDLTSAIPYERLTKDLYGKSPFASGDYGSHRSIYGGAYALWWGELVSPTEDPFILQFNLSRSDFLCPQALPTYLYYNPSSRMKTVTMQLEKGTFDIYDLVTHAFISKSVRGKLPLDIPGNGSKVIVVVPSHADRQLKNSMLLCDGVPIDYQRRQQ